MKIHWVAKLLATSQWHLRLKGHEWIKLSYLARFLRILRQAEFSLTCTDNVEPIISCFLWPILVSPPLLNPAEPCSNRVFLWICSKRSHHWRHVRLSCLQFYPGATVWHHECDSMLHLLLLLLTLCIYWQIANQLQTLKVHTAPTVLTCVDTVLV